MENYNALVVLDTTATDEMTICDILERLGPKGARLYPAISWDSRGRMVVTVTLAAGNVAQVTELAAGLVRAAAKSTVLSVEVMTPRTTTGATSADRTDMTATLSWSGPIGSAHLIGGLDPGTTRSPPIVWSVVESAQGDAWLSSTDHRLTNP